MDFGGFWCHRNKCFVSKHVDQIVEFNSLVFTRRILLLCVMHSPSSLDSAPTPRKVRRVLLLVLVAFLAGFFLFRIRQGKGANHRLDAIRKAGFPASLRELDALYAPVPVNENAAAILTEAHSQTAAPVDSKSLPIIGEVELPKPPMKLPAELRLAISEHLQQNEAALRTARKALQIDRSRYAVDLNQGGKMALTHLAQITELFRLLRLETVYFSDLAETERAVESTLTSLAVVRSLEPEPILISQLVRIGCEAAAVEGLQRTLSESRLSDDQLRRVAEVLHWHEMAGEKALARSLAGERCFGIARFEPPASQSGVALPAAPLGKQIAFNLYRMTGLRDVGFTFYLKAMEDIIAAAQLPFPDSVRRNKEVSDWMNTEVNRNKLFLFSKTALLLVDTAIIKQAKLTAKLRAAQTALAVERFRWLHRGELPASLDELAPAFLPSVPVDPADGSPLHYERLEIGYKIVADGTTAVDSLPRREGRPKRFVGFSVTR